MEHADVCMLKCFLFGLCSCETDQQSGIDMILKVRVQKLTAEELLGKNKKAMSF